MSTLISRLRSLVLALGTGLAVAFTGTVSANAQEDFKQIELTDSIVASFIAAQKDYEPLAKKLIDAGEKLDDGLSKELDDVAKKHGFADFANFEDVGANITLVLEGYDRESGTFSDPKALMQKELEDIKADDSIPANEKKEILKDLEQEIAAVPPLQYPSNVDVVKKHLKEIEALLPDEADDGEDT